MDLILSAQAMIEMDRIAEHIQKSSPPSALRFLEAVEVTGSQLLANPEMGSLLESDEPKLHGLRVWLVDGFEKYLVIYRIRRESLRIERVVHSSRDLPTILKE